MGFLTKEAVLFFRPVKRKLKRCCRPFIVNNDSMATNVEQDRQQDDKDHNGLMTSQVIVVRSSASLQTALKTEGAKSQNLGLTLGERIDHQRLPEETKQRLFNETLRTRWTDSSSDSKQNSWLDLYQEKQMQQKVTNAQVELNLSDDDTRLVNGLLTTTLCSTEL